MYTPAQFEETRPAVLQDLMRTQPLATLVAVTPNGLTADHIPLLFDATDSSPRVLRGHVARANPIWRELEPGARVLAIFQGPSHYVSPNWYPAKKEHGKVVPTWNYVVVHVRGAIDWQHDPAWLRALLEALTNGQEASRAEPWQVRDAPVAYTDRMIASIVGFEITISSITGKWKLSQNRSDADRAGVAAGLAAEGTVDAQRMMALLRGGIGPG
jgi:transcriptional regulator